ncbi:uncharacterized protein LOC109545395 isoform X1 [Dendroctonus ponderosae]|uniref:uncharacterized protein LOC109545395 isoform X1 n=2 Tax=Dendroctonus ponderosae TaxID=77166 RepID=UPI0020366568|nr:uncharacterized protein LOC109545395 isoform X1 [Dendroctonus ponderosae]XP_048522665.1 uncharacterized protein LOC109545395 isoform X1 [Dendroctonus ponderosae]
MSSFTRMKRIFLDGLIWLFLLQYGFTALSLEPGFLDFDNLPDTNFSCHGKVIGGYYADVETNCQMFHVCTKGQAGENMDIRFLCLNGTVFDQETRVCERIDEVDCSKSEQFYSLNLELYQHSGQNSEDIPEVSQETEAPTKSTTTSTTTTTKNPTTSQYFTTARPVAATAASNSPQAVSGHHFPVNAPDIRFNPEEINISLNPGAPPDIRTKHFQLPQGFSDDSSEVSHGDEHERERLSASTSPKSIYAIDSDSDKLPQNSDYLEENFRSTERQPQFLIQTNSFRHSQSFPPNSHQYHHPQFHSTTVKHSGNFPRQTTSRTIYLHSLKPPQVHQHHHYTHHPRTEKTPQRVQIPIPLLPTLPPLTFSSPAPFTLQHHIDSKRYTKEHQSPPRIIISASASVSDASGRRLNYSLGTIGAAQILDTPPSSYDEYKDGDVGLDPFYHDVPKIQERKRRKRSTDENPINPFEIIKNEKEAVEVLKFLYTWYQSHQATATVPPPTSPVSSDLIQTINNELAPRIEEIGLNPESSEIHSTSSKEATSTESMKPHYGELFKKGGRFSLVGGYRNEPVFNGENHKKLAERMDVGDKTRNSDIIVKDFKELPFSTHDYVDDNYEGVTYRQSANSQEVQPKKDKPLDLNLPQLVKNTPNHTNPEREFEATKEPGREEVGDAPETTAPFPAGFADTEETSTDQTRHFTDRSSADLLYKYLQLTPETSSTSPKEHQNVTETSGKVTKHTEINVLSETREAEPNKATSSTSVSPPRRQGGRRRGGIKQKQLDSYQAASYNVPNSSAQREAQNYISTPPNKPSARRGRNRGRSRFATSTSTTELSPAVSTSSWLIHFEETSALRMEETTVASAVENSTTEAPLPEATNPILQEREATVVTEAATFVTPSSTQEATDFIPFSNTITTDSSTDPLSTTEENAREAVSELNPPAPTASYLIELLKHFAQSDDSAIYAPFTTEAPTSYDPLTETLMSSLPSFVTPKPERRRSRHRHSSKVSTTQLPTLRDISRKNSPLISSKNESESKSKADLLDKLSAIEKHLIEGDLPTTIGAPVVISEETPSTEMPETSTVFQELAQFHIDAKNYYDDVFVVPESTTRNSSEPQEELKLTESTTEAAATEGISSELNPDEATTKMYLDLGELATTLLPDVEIQKSISLPVSVLDVPYPINDAHSINGLFSNEETSTSTSIPSEWPSSTTTLPFAVTTEVLPDPTEYPPSDPPMRQVHDNSTEIIFVKTDQSLDNPRAVNSSHLYQVVLESSSEQPSTTTSGEHFTQKSRPLHRRPHSHSKTEYGRHRFNTELLSKNPSFTVAPLHRSVSPTKPRALKKVLLHTTPLSSKSPRPPKVSSRYVFNCFGKETNRFYADPRDCRLFHYCTNGYSKNQLLDLKYVCDQKTFFDEDRVICTKVKPARCV